MNGAKCNCQLAIGTMAFLNGFSYVKGNYLHYRGVILCKTFSPSFPLDWCFASIANQKAGQDQRSPDVRLVILDMVQFSGLPSLLKQHTQELRVCTGNWC